jgi:hypothetical protein
MEASGKIPPDNLVLDGLRPFGLCQGAQQKPEGWRPLHPLSDYSPDRLVKAGCFAKLDFEFHDPPFTSCPLDYLPDMPGISGVLASGWDQAALSSWFVLVGKFEPATPSHPL